MDGCKLNLDTPTAGRGHCTGAKQPVHAKRLLPHVCENSLNNVQAPYLQQNKQRK